MQSSDFTCLGLLNLAMESFERRGLRRPGPQHTNTHLIQIGIYCIMQYNFLNCKQKGRNKIQSHLRKGRDELQETESYEGKRRSNGQQEMLVGWLVHPLLTLTHIHPETGAASDWLTELVSHDGVGKNRTTLYIYTVYIFKK